MLLPIRTPAAQRSDTPRTVAAPPARALCPGIHRGTVPVRAALPVPGCCPDGVRPMSGVRGGVRVSKPRWHCYCGGHFSSQGHPTAGG
jgi:hypothetical protein